MYADGLKQALRGKMYGDGVGMGRTSCPRAAVYSQQTRPQFCRLQITESHSGMRLSETARDVKHR